MMWHSEEAWLLQGFAHLNRMDWWWQFAMNDNATKTTRVYAFQRKVADMDESQATKDYRRFGMY